MNIKPYDKTIRDLLGSKRQFLIPRFQREYSWDKKNYKEFIEDMLNNLVYNETGISSSQYFLGTMLFIGDFSEGTQQEIQVVDGQQRLTTITILFSALSDCFKDLHEQKLSQQIFTYIMTEDDNGEEVRILKSKTSYPFFSYFIQDKDKNNIQDPLTEEEHCISQTYDFFKSYLKEPNLKSFLSKKFSKEKIDKIPLVEILKALRDQVLNSTFVSISTTDKNQANSIFEILNAKGKRLADIDLIKNKLFEILNKEEPADFAEDSWKILQDILNSRDESVGLATFYRHFWASKFKKTTSTKLYDSFKSTIIPKNEKTYSDFLTTLIENAKNYIKIVNPRREDYNNRKEYYWLVQSLNVLNNYFNIVQVRIALLALYDLKQRDIIGMKDFKQTILYLENFHFVYTALYSQRPNRFEKIYSKFAINIRKVDTKVEAKKIIAEQLINELEVLFGDYKTFCNKFITLTYSKKNSISNMKTKYVLNKINCYFSKNEIFEDNATIEHIIPEKDGETLNVGNLILLEHDLNVDASNFDFIKKCENYKESNYKWVKEFCKNNKEWDKNKIKERASQLADLYYTKILKREK